jgi:hypothetical protein
MSTSPTKDNVFSNYSTSKADFLTYLVTPVDDLNMIRTYNVISGAKEVSSEIIEEQQKIISFPSIEPYLDRIEIKHEDFIKFKNRLESEEVFDNPNLIKLLEDYLE